MAIRRSTNFFTIITKVHKYTYNFEKVLHIISINDLSTCHNEIFCCNYAVKEHKNILTL